MESETRKFKHLTDSNGGVSNSVMLILLRLINNPNENSTADQYLSFVKQYLPSEVYRVSIAPIITVLSLFACGLMTIYRIETDT
jgi:hypothetical protein